ncbi:MAG: hypothetical protein JXA73_10860 [Acidobacteria bacterium]|nr:hypothetical protein [Acidobacteriota bacterium]
MAEFERIKKDHAKAVRMRAARIVLGPSVMRVYRKGTGKQIMPILARISIDEIAKVGNQKQFKAWFEYWLEVLAKEILRLNSTNDRIHPGYKWGHSTKILTLYIRELVINTRYFKDPIVDTIVPFLYSPIDSVVINRLLDLGCDFGFLRIKDIDTPEKFYSIQDLLDKPAKAVGAPRIWFDDNWGDRQTSHKPQRITNAPDL